MYSPENYGENSFVITDDTEKELQRKKERSRLRRYSLSAGLMVVASSILFTVISYCLVWFIKSLGTSLYFPKDIDTVPNDIISSLTSLTAFLITGLVFLKVNKSSLSEALPFNKVRPFKFFALIVIGFSVCMFSNVLTSAFMEVVWSFGLNPMSYHASGGEAINSPIEIILALLSTAVVPAISEEFVFRGVMLSSLRKFGDGFAVLATALLFGFMHGNLVQIPFAFIVGLVLGFVTVSTNSMLPAMLIHALNNSYSVLNDILYQNYTDYSMTSEGVYLILLSIIITFLILAIIMTVILSKKDKDFMKLKGYDGPLTKKEINRGFYLFPTVIIAFAYMTIEAAAKYLPINLG